MPPKKKSAGGNQAAKKIENAHQSVLGGMNGGYRVTGEEHKNDDNVQPFEVPFKDKAIICERRGGDGPDTEPTLIFTHGAGGGLANPATREFAEGFAATAPVVCFQGTMNLHSRTQTFHAVADHEKTISAFGGRSMGARAAVIAATEREKTRSLVLVSYPLVGASNGEVRDKILYDLPKEANVLFITGSNDSMCDVKHVQRVIEKMQASCWLVEVEGADHGMSLKQKKGVKPVREKTGSIAAEWLRERSEDNVYCRVEWDNDAGEVVSTGWKSNAEEAAPAENVQQSEGQKKRKRQSQISFQGQVKAKQSNKS